VGPLRAVLVGDPNGLPISYEQSRDLMLTFGSMPWMFPHEVQEDNHYSSKLYASMNNGETTFPVKMVEVEMQNGSVYAPNNKDVLNGEFFNRIDGDGRLKILQKNIDRWYKNDKNLFDHNVLTPFVPPKGIDHVISVYGVNVPTPVGARYKEQEGFFEEVELITNDGGRVTSSLTSRSAIPKSRSYRTRQSGDGTVPYASLSWAFSFFDENVPVNLTMVPSHRSYEEDDILTFENVGENLTSLMKSKEHNRFFVQRSIGVSRRTGLPKLKTTQVWEIQGVAHRDSVTDSRVLEQLRSVLLKNKKMKRKLRDIRTESRRDLEQSVMSLMRQDMIYDVVLEHAAWSHDKQPESDDACFWDYAKVRCAWARYCEYVSLSLSLSLSAHIAQLTLAHIIIDINTNWATYIFHNRVVCGTNRYLMILILKRITLNLPWRRLRRKLFHIVTFTSTMTSRGNSFTWNLGL